MHASRFVIGRAWPVFVAFLRLGVTS
ncbi:chromate transport protein, partial [Burkholderia pseudomallei 354e]